MSRRDGSFMRGAASVTRQNIHWEGAAVAAATVSVVGQPLGSSDMKRARLANRDEIRGSQTPRRGPVEAIPGGAARTISATAAPGLDRAHALSGPGTPEAPRSTVEPPRPREDDDAKHRWPRVTEVRHATAARGRRAAAGGQRWSRTSPRGTRAQVRAPAAAQATAGAQHGAGSSTMWRGLVARGPVDAGTDVIVTACEAALAMQRSLKRKLSQLTGAVQRAARGRGNRVHCVARGACVQTRQSSRDAAWRAITSPASCKACATSPQRRWICTAPTPLPPRARCRRARPQSHRSSGSVASAGKATVPV